MALRREGSAPETGGSPGTPGPSFRRRRWTRTRIGALASAVGAVGALVLAVLSPTAAATVTTVQATPPSVTFTDECDGTVSVEIVNPEGNGNIAISYGVPDSYLSVFTSQTPALADFNDAQAVTLGTWIQAGVAGQVHGIRWYFPATLPSSAPIGLLYSASGTELARATFSSPVAGTWNEVLFDTPIAVGAGDYVVAAVYTPDRYVATNGFFSTSGLTNGVLSAPVSGLAPPDPAGNGVFFYSGANPGFPGDTFNATSYFADVLFTEGGVVEPDGVSHVITVPAGAGEISVTGAGLDLTHTWSQPGDCSPADVTFTDNCNGTVTVTVTNPQGNEEITVSWTGDSETVADDGQEHVITVPSTGGQITVTGAGVNLTHTWTEPDNCSPPTTTPTPETTDPGTTTTLVPGTSTLPNLPKTGSSLTGLLWAGAALLLSGIALLLLVSDARSRRDRPTEA